MAYFTIEKRTVTAGIENTDVFNSINYSDDELMRKDYISHWNNYVQDFGTINLASGKTKLLELHIFINGKIKPVMHLIATVERPL